MHTISTTTTTTTLTEIPSPYPLHLPLTCCSWFVEVTCSAVCLVHDGWRLETIGQDDVRVHGPNVKMVDHGILVSSRIVPKDGQLVYNSLTDLGEREHRIVDNCRYLHESTKLNLSVKTTQGMIKQKMVSVVFVGSEICLYRIPNGQEK